MDETTKELVGILTSQNGMLKDALFWSLTTIGGLITIFLTLNYFANRNFRKEEINKVRAEIELSLQNDYLIRMKEELKKEVQDEIQKRISERNTELTALRDELDKLEEKVNKEEKENNEKYLTLSAKIRIAEAELWSQRGVHLNSLDNYVDAGNIVYNLQTGLLEMILHKIEENINEIPTLNVWKKSKIQALLDKLDPKYSVAKAQIESLMEKKPSQ
jgi:Skp family chaperone for outer membrane proteins